MDHGIEYSLNDNSSSSIESKKEFSFKKNIIYIIIIAIFLCALAIVLIVTLCSGSSEGDNQRKEALGEIICIFDTI